MAQRAPLFLAAALVLLLVVGSTAINVASAEHGAVGRHLLQEGCAKWVLSKDKKKTCVSCYKGYYMKSGYCYKETKGHNKGPANTGIYKPSGH